MKNYDDESGLKKAIFAATLLLQEHAPAHYVLLDETPAAESGDDTGMSTTDYRNYLETLLLQIGAVKADPAFLFTGLPFGRLQYQPFARIQFN